MDKYEKAIMDLCYNLVQNVYLPIREFIQSINTEGETYNFGSRIEFFKGEIEKVINSLKE
jgi:hypothetical protein